VAEDADTDFTVSLFEDTNGANIGGNATHD
jgi:hypothetical protein